MKRDEVASAVAKRLNLCEGSCKDCKPPQLWDALIDSELRNQELSEALRNAPELPEQFFDIGQVMGWTGSYSAWFKEIRARALLSEEKKP